MKSQKIKKLLLPILLCVTLPSLFNCKVVDDNSVNEPEFALLCYTLGVCNNVANVKFGLIGDSWTELAMGTEIRKAIRPNLEDDHNFKLTGATVAGQQLETVLDNELHFNVINNAGDPVKYMLVSLGGNDLNYNGTYYELNPAQEKSRIEDRIKGLLSQLVATGNQHKIERVGGEPLKWFIHGYDYLNPDNPYQRGIIESNYRCREHWVGKGLLDTPDLNTKVQDIMESYNQMLAQLAAENEHIEHINLMGTLGGPSVSNAALMTDCIHPNDEGYKIISNEYVRQLDGFTGGER